MSVRLFLRDNPTLGWRRWPVLCARIVLGAVFIYSGVLKAGAPQFFADSIASFGLLPDMFIAQFALGLPVFEILVGSWLVSGWRRRQAAFCAIVLDVVFLIALGSATARGIAVDCGCFGAAIDPIIGGKHAAVVIGRDLVLGAVALWLYLSASDRAQCEAAPTIH